LSKNAGIVLLFTGLSGSGKSTLSSLVYKQVLEANIAPVTLLDGDVFRTNHKNDLSYSKKDRELNISRVGDVAKEIIKNKEIAICALIAPYQESRNLMRKSIENYGCFVEIYVSTPLSVCEERDSKGMYAKARKGIIKNFTGISDPYENPVNPEIKIDTTGKTPIECAQQIMLYLFKEGYIA